MGKHEKSNSNRGDEFQRRKRTVSKALAQRINLYRSRQLPMLCPCCRGPLMKCRQSSRLVTICGKCGSLNDVETQQENL
jgi:hypothetical protein